LKKAAIQDNKHILAGGDLKPGWSTGGIREYKNPVNPACRVDLRGAVLSKTQACSEVW